MKDKDFLKYNKNNFPEITADDLNNVRQRVLRLENLIAKPPLNLNFLHDKAFLSLTRHIFDIGFFIAKNHMIPPSTNSVQVNGIKGKSTTPSGLPTDWEIDLNREETVYNFFNYPILKDKSIFCIRERQLGKWIHIPIGDNEIYGLIVAPVKPCTTNNFLARLVRTPLGSWAPDGSFISFENPFDWDVKTDNGNVFVHCHWSPDGPGYIADAFDCDSTCLG